jgi:hypothetical protein
MKSNMSLNINQTYHPSHFFLLDSDEKTQLLISTCKHVHSRSKKGVRLTYMGAFHLHS